MHSSDNIPEGSDHYPVCSRIAQAVGSTRSEEHARSRTLSLPFESSRIQNVEASYGRFS